MGRSGVFPRARGEDSKNALSVRATLMIMMRVGAVTLIARAPETRYLITGSGRTEGGTMTMIAHVV